MKKLALILAVMFLPPMSEAFEGFVQLESGAPVSGAQVMLFDLKDLHAAPQTAITDPSGHFTLTTSALPEGFSLGDNYPNPFNPSTLIPYQLLASMHVRLDVFNVLGQRIKTLVNGHQPAGSHTVRWDATDARGQAVGAGVYLYRLSAEGVQTTRPMLLIDGGIPLRPGGGFTRKTTEKSPAYGLVVFASGLTPYVNPRPDDALEIALETPPGEKVAVNRILGDLDENGIVDFSDVLLVVLYRRNASTSPDTNIMLGDVNGDGEIDGTDVRLISKYVKDPTDPTLPMGIGQPVETDLALGSFSISDSTLTPNQIFTLTASVSNQGTLGLSQTTLRWYRSIDQTITSQDTEVGSTPLSSIAAGGTITESIELTAPSTEDTHYYGACVASISDETDAQNNCSPAVRVTVTRPSPGFAPEDQAAFNQRMVGRSIHLLTLSIDLVSAGRFSEEGALPGSYIYFNTGSHTGTLNLTYDMDHFGGSCSLQLTFDSTTTGTLNFHCASGIEGQTVWRLSEIGTPIAPIVVPISSSRVGARFQDIFETGETRAYDWQIRRKGLQEPWISLCSTFSNEGRRNTLSPVQLFSGLDPGTTYEIRYRYRNSSRCKEGRPGPWSEIGEGTIFSEEEFALRFPEGGSTTRSIPENLPSNINVGDPVSAVAADSLRILTYTLKGPDAERFLIDAETGQLRTWEYYDYERKNQYTVTVGVEDDRDNSDSIEVIIEIADLAPLCGESSDFNLRTRSDDKGLTLRWDPLEDRQGHAQVLGYQTEIRIGAGGEWDGRRTLFGNDISGTIYRELTNDVAYHIRIRCMNAEEECNWSTPALGIPTDNLAPKNAVDNFERNGTKPIGSDERNIRFLTPGRCRHTGDGQTLDADCIYKNTGPQTGRILLEFDDPSRAPCDASMTYSSQTAGSFLDKCFSAGINVPFDMGFSMWRERSTPETVQRSPRNQDEFDELVFGRDDLIPGLCFGNCISGSSPRRGSARRFDFESGVTNESEGSYTYEKTGPSQGVLTFMEDSGKTWVFTLDFDRSGNISVNTTDPNGNPTTWPGFEDLDLSLGVAQPVLLPVPPSWLASGSERLEIPVDQQNRIAREVALSYLPLAECSDPNCASLNWAWDYQPLGGNRGILIIEFPERDLEKMFAGIEDPQRSLKEHLNGSTLVYEMNFVSDEVAEYTLTITKDGHPPRVEKGVFDVVGGKVNIDNFPEELFLPDEDPQAAGADMSGTEVAAAVTSGQITGDDVQPFLVSSTADYEPGDWLEPKDGGDQRMMVVGGSGSPASAKILPEHNSPVLKSRFTAFPQASPIMALPRAKRVSQAFSSTLTQLYVVCMQRDRDIPIRGARYFSRPKTAQTPVERCQRDCVLNESRNIQRCVWECEADAQ